MPTVYARAVKRAAEIKGEHALAAHLGVTHSQLALWMRGTVQPPVDVFLKVVDLLSEYAVITLSGGSATPPDAED